MEVGAQTQTPVRLELPSSEPIYALPEERARWNRVNPVYHSTCHFQLKVHREVFEEACSVIDIGLLYLGTNSSSRELGNLRQWQEGRRPPLQQEPLRLSRNRTRVLDPQTSGVFRVSLPKSLPIQLQLQQMALPKPATRRKVSILPHPPYLLRNPPSRSLPSRT